MWSPEMSFPASMEFSALGLGLAALVAVYLLVVEPWWGKRAYADLKVRRDTDPGALLRFFGSGAAIGWGLTAVTLLIVAVSPGVRFADIGFVAPEEGLAEALGTLVGIVIGLVLLVVVLRLVKFDHKLLPGQKAVSAMLPRDRRERWAGAGMSVTAGVWEEIVFRGLLIALGVSLGLSVQVAAIAGLVVFTFAHLYQGRTGLFFVALFGFGMTHLYLSTGSLLAPIAVHTLVDLRALLFTPGSEGGQKSGKPEETQEPGKRREFATIIDGSDR